MAHARELTPKAAVQLSSSRDRILAESDVNLPEELTVRDLQALNRQLTIDTSCTPGTRSSVSLQTAKDDLAQHPTLALRATTPTLLSRFARRQTQSPSQSSHSRQSTQSSQGSQNGRGMDDIDKSLSNWFDQYDNIIERLSLEKEKLEREIQVKKDEKAQIAIQRDKNEQGWRDSQRINYNLRQEMRKREEQWKMKEKELMDEAEKWKKAYEVKAAAVQRLVEVIQE